MNTPSKNFCFCTLALGKKYSTLAQNLARDLDKYSSDTKLIIYTDHPEDFIAHPNVLAFKHTNQSIGACYHDKRFVISKALSLFKTAIFIDADSHIVAPVPEGIDWKPGITTGVFKNIYEMKGNKNHPQKLQYIDGLVKKLDLSPSKVNWTDENLLVFTQDQGKEDEFFKLWDKIALYFQLRHIHSGEGNAIGLAAAKVGWEFTSENWHEIDQVRKHWHEYSWKVQAGLEKGKVSPPLVRFLEKVNYQYRLNRGRIKAALIDFNWYYS